MNDFSMLTDIAIADAYGAAFEYVRDSKFYIRNDLKRYYKHPTHNIKPGCYTDDTQMSIAIARLMLSNDIWTKRTLAHYFLDTFRLDPREGYAKNFYNFLKSTKTADEFVSNIKPVSVKAGAAMRSGVIGLYSEIDKVIEYATLNAKLTHDTKTGINSSIAAALMVHYFVHAKGSVSGLLHFLNNCVSMKCTDTWQGFVGADGMDAVNAAITAIVSSDSLSEVLRKCVDFRGDTDTVAAIAIASATNCSEIKHDLPQKLYDKLEDGPFGRKYLRELDSKLSAFIV
ncbi:ADP-ribosylglycohydrolase [Methanococcus maripaludis]|uniref:ADP-ribosylglycohydrolase n=1 Tax=Methanococcus maripaludis TaxID=39152 RepID=A0A7J9S773_METMI|nr:ADP-ribosylglycohydrolase family protein [Methanococcus maripaludis]MBB6402505.1 ADP-ribosylglycohydrolase [Methanococcus maripaludis]